MNIKAHVEAGHYPVDEKGRALVPMVNGETATISATDGPKEEKLVGWYSNGSVCSWEEDGHFAVSSHRLDLLPPPPRKVKVTAWLCLEAGSMKVCSAHIDRSSAEFACCSDERIAEITGECEVLP